MFSYFKWRAFLLFLGFLLIAIFIWFAGPLFAFAEYRPLEPPIVRLIAIALVILCWLGSALLKRLRAGQASDKLVAAVLKQAPAGSDAGPSAEAAKLRERFEGAVATLKQQRRGGHSLYDLPWYVIIGAPGSGKTTALINSGLKFPLESRVGKGALRGVGGTRNCDWWFTDEAVFLDTAGRYTTQDSDASADSAGWREFLALLRKYRKRRPINGVILTISAEDLMVQGDAGREAHVEAARRRLRELNEELRIHLPVYLMVTKGDLVAGFTEYFDDLAQDTRAQVWGVTFPYEQTASGEAAQAFPAEFDTLIGRLNGRLFARVEEDRDVRRRVKVFAFPQQMAGLREALTQFVRDVFDSSGFVQPILLRGVYFTSGTQEGTPIDRLLGAIGRRFGVAADAVAFPAGRGKAYFVERLLKTVLIGESGLAGVNRRVEVQKAALQLAAYAAMALIVAAAVLAWSLSYRRNSTYLDEVVAEVANLRQVPEVRVDAPLERLLPRLDATRAVLASANRYQAETPRAMRWGLYQGASVTKSAQDAYVRELDGLVLPRFASRIKERLVQYEREPDKLYEYLKAYLMLGEPKRLDKKHLQALADLEWKRPAPTQIAGRAATSLSEHFESLLDYSDELRPIPLDAGVVARARGTIRQASIPKIMYSRIKRDYDDDSRAVALDAAAGLGVEHVLKRKSGISLSKPVPALYGRAVFKEVTGRGAAELIKDLSTDDWVWGGTALSVDNPLKLAGDVFDIYEQDYITVWDAVLNDLELATFPTVRQTADALGTLSGPTSPLRGLLRVVADNTMLIDVPDEAAPPSSGALSSAKNAVADRLGKLLKSAQQASGASTRMPGTLVTAHFQPIHRLLAGAPGMAPIDKILDRIAQIQQELNSLGPGVGNTDALTALSSPSLRGLLQSLKEDAALLPPSVETLVTQIGHRAQGSVVSDATDNLERRYREQLVEPCLAVVAGRYPFVVGSTQDVTLKDFARLFGPGGLFEGFFNDNHLDRLADTSHSPWTWRNGGPNLSPRMLAQFEAAERVREVFFPSGALGMGLGFKVSFSGLDPRLTRFALQIDNQYYEIRHSPPPQTRSAKWPASDPGNAIAQFEGLGGPLTVARFDGPWAWFRLMDVGRPQRESDLRVSLAFQRDDYKVQAMIEPDSIRNPFTNRAWRNFSCGS